MKEFMFFIRKQSHSSQALPQDIHQQFLKSCEQYIDALKARGQLLAAQPFDRSGRILSGKAGAWMEKDFDESAEIIGGYYHIQAQDLAEAMEIARANPEFAYHKDTRIEVRPLKTREESTGYTYPTETGQKIVPEP